MSDINVAEDKMDNLERQRAMAVKNYNDYAHRWEESRISEELDRRRVANISMLGAPTLPLQPVAPRRKLIMFLSMPAGLLLGIAIAALMQGLSDKIQRPRDLASIEGLAYLGTFESQKLLSFAVRPANILYLARTWGVGGAQTLIGLMLRNLPRDEFKIIVVPYDAPEKAETEFLAFLRKQSISTCPIAFHGADSPAGEAPVNASGNLSPDTISTSSTRTITFRLR